MRIEFHDFQLDADRYLLIRNGAAVSLRPKVFDLLIHLARHRHRVVPREELVRMLWSETSVGAGSLSGLVNELRRALGESGDTSATLRTVHARGYQFVAAVRVMQEASGDSDAEPGETPSEPAATIHADLFGRIVDRLGRIEAEGSCGVWIDGPAASGKSLLLDELLVWSAHHGFAVHRIDAGPHSSVRHGIAESIRDALVATWGFSALAPEMRSPGAARPDPILERDSLTAGSGASGLEIRQLEDRVQRALADSMKHVAERGPLIVAIDGLDVDGGRDAQWLANLLSQLETAPCALMATSRPERARPGSDGGGNLFKRHRRVTSFRLGPLDARSLAAVFESEGLPPLPAPLAASLIRYAISSVAPIEKIGHWLGGHREAEGLACAPNRRVRSVRTQGTAAEESSG